MTKLSVIIPCHNSEKTIRRAVKSCVDQTERDIEIIVVDNGSDDNDGTAAIVDEFNDARVKYLTIKDGNRSRARNLGLKVAKGKYIQLLDADDSIDREKIRKSCAFLNENGDYFAFITGTQFWEAGSLIRREIPVLGDLTIRNTVELNSVVFRNSKLTMFDENLAMCEDWLFWVYNLSNKNVFLDDSYFANNKYITDSNTMRDFNGMLFYTYVVRKMISRDNTIKSGSFRFYRHALTEMLQLLCLDLTSEQQMIMNLDAGVIMRFSRLVIKVPMVKSIIDRRVKSVLREYKYRNDGN